MTITPYSLTGMQHLACFCIHINSAAIKVINEKSSPIFLDNSSLAQSFAMMLNILPSQFFLPHDAIKLGRFITSIDHPYQNYHDPPCAQSPKPIISPRSCYSGLHHNANSSGFGSALTSFISAGFSKRAKTKVRIATEQVKTYTLEKSDEWFEDAMGTEATRNWIERAVDQGYDIYMIVGFHVVTDALIIQESVLGKEAGGQINLPVSLSLSAVGLIAPLGNIVDPRVGGQRQIVEGVQTQFLVPGEQVCALQYRKVRHKWLSSRTINNSSLSKNPQWASTDKWRDEEEDEEEEDVIEVEMTDSLGLGGEWEQVDASEGEVLLIRSDRNGGSDETK